MKKLFWFAIILWNGLMCAQAATDFIYMTPVTGTSGSIGSISAMMSNPRAKRACAFQCDIIMPDGVTIVDGSLQLSDRCEGFNIITKQISKNVYRVLCYSPDMTPLEGTSGEVFSYDVRIGSTMKADAYIVRIKNLVIADDNTVCVFDQTPRDGTSQVMVTTQYGIGDVNRDRSVDVQDIPAWIASLMSSDPVGDVNDDGKIDAVDIALLLDNILTTDY